MLAHPRWSQVLHPRTLQPHHRRNGLHNPWYSHYFRFIPLLRADGTQACVPNLFENEVLCRSPNQLDLSKMQKLTDDERKMHEETR